MCERWLVIVSYFCKKGWSTTAEMSRRGLPMPRRMPSDAILTICFFGPNGNAAAAAAPANEWVVGRVRRYSIGLVFICD